MTWWKQPFQCPSCDGPHSGARLFCKNCLILLLQLRREAHALNCGALVYEGPVRALLNELRRQPSPRLFRILRHSAHRSPKFQALWRECDAIAAVPARSKLILAPAAPIEIFWENLAALHGKIWMPRLLRKKFDHSQHERGAKARLDTPLFMEINPRSRHAREIRGKRILLVDDVCTTGTSLLQCSQVLLEQGAFSVSRFTFAEALAKDRADYPLRLRNEPLPERTNPQPPPSREISASSFSCASEPG